MEKATIPSEKCTAQHLQENERKIDLSVRNLISNVKL